MQPISLNARASKLIQRITAESDVLQIDVIQRDDGGLTIDFGVNTTGNTQAGIMLATVCLADLANIEVVNARDSISAEFDVHVECSNPIPACMASQYAGWQISCGDYFGMGSGPMRAAYGSEDIYNDIGFKEQADSIVGVLESSKLPDSDTVAMIAGKCGVSPEKVTLAVAPTSSIAGTIQVVARSLETALHKMHELEFDLSHVTTGKGIAPLAPVATDDLGGIGLTNDAVLYGGDVTIEVNVSDDEINEIGPRIPSSASDDFGRPFLETFKSYDYDFYKIDPLLFSPAKITLKSLLSGNAFTFGSIRDDILQESFSNVSN